METKKHYNTEEIIKDFEELDDYKKVSKKHKISIYLVKKILNKKRSEEHTSELQSHSFISYAVFCLKKKKTNNLNN